MPYMLTADGHLVDTEGNEVKIGDELVTVENAQPNDKVEKTIKERLARQTDRIKSLEAQANKAPELEKLLNELRDEKTHLESQLSEAQRAAEDRVSAQLNTATRKAQELEEALKAERTGRLQDQVTNMVLAKAGDKFNNAQADVVPKLLNVHKREPKQGEDGKPIEGQFVDLFEMSFLDGEKQVTDMVPIDKALEIFASAPENQHYVRASNAGGSGGGGQFTNPQNLKRSKMSDAQKAAFARDHGVEAFQSLPQ